MKRSVSQIPLVDQSRTRLKVRCDFRANGHGKLDLPEGTKGERMDALNQVSLIASSLSWELELPCCHVCVKKHAICLAAGRTRR